jgi:hypothetical protein
VLSTPPAFVLSQDQTLRGKFESSEIPLFEVSGHSQAKPLFSFQGTNAFFSLRVPKIMPKKIR